MNHQDRVSAWSQPVPALVIAAMLTGCLDNADNATLQSAASADSSATPTTASVGASSDISSTAANALRTGSVSPLRFRVKRRSTTGTPTEINLSPTITGTPAASAVAGATYDFAPVAADANSNILSFSIQNRPSWATFSTTTGRLNGTPAAADVGSYANIVVSVSDGLATASLPAFTVTVTPIATGSATLSWTAPTENTDGTVLTNLAGYRIYYGTNANSLTQVINVPTVGITTYLISNLGAGSWHFAIKAFNSAGIESSLSPIVSMII